MRRTSIIASLGVALVVGAAMWRASEPPAPPRASPPDYVVHYGPQRSQRVSEGSKPGAAPSAMQPSGPQGSPADEPRVHLPAETPTAPSRVTGPLAARFEAEAVDAAWAEPTEQRIRALYDDADLSEVELTALACRTTLCRVEVHYPDAEAFVRMAVRIGERGPLAGSRGAADVGDHAAITYVERESLLAAHEVERR